MKNLTFCSYCSKYIRLIWVHGHGQCPDCKINIDECCRGENCEINDKSKEKNE